MNTTTETETVLARHYAHRGCLELIHTPKGYIVSVNGRVEDARAVYWLGAEEAREWYDTAAYKIGERP